uniref:Uncharacterized protein n=1 Tax=Arcella intermedia TaxID=1963864 RepID=A0A6B2KWF2_9EUKA
MQKEFSTEELLKSGLSESLISKFMDYHSIYEMWERYLLNTLHGKCPTVKNLAMFMQQQGDKLSEIITETDLHRISKKSINKVRQALDVLTKLTQLRYCPIHSTSGTDFVNLWNSLCVNLSTSIDKIEIDESLKGIETVDVISTAFEVIGDDEVILKYQSFKSDLIDRLIGFVKSQSTLLNQVKKFESSDFEQMENIFVVLNQLSNKDNINTYFHWADIDKLYQEFIFLVIPYFEKVEQRVVELLDSQKEASFEDIGELVKDLHTIQKLDTRVENATAAIFVKILNRMINFVNNSKQEVEMLLGQLEIDSSLKDKFPYNKLRTFFQNLQKCIWIEDHMKGTFTSFQKEFRRVIFSHTTNIGYLSSNLALNIDNCSNLKEAEILFKCTRELQTNLEEIINTLKSHEENNDNFTEKLNSIFFNIKKRIDDSLFIISKSINFSKVQQLEIEKLTISLNELLNIRKEIESNNPITAILKSKDIVSVEHLHGNINQLEGQIKKLNAEKEEATKNLNEFENNESLLKYFSKKEIGEKRSSYKSKITEIDTEIEKTKNIYNSLIKIKEQVDLEQKTPFGQSPSAVQILNKFNYDSFDNLQKDIATVENEIKSKKDPLFINESIINSFNPAKIEQYLEYLHAVPSVIQLYTFSAPNSSEITTQQVLEEVEKFVSKYVNLVSDSILKFIDNLSPQNEEQSLKIVTETRRICTYLQSLKNIKNYQNLDKSVKKSGGQDVNDFFKQLEEKKGSFSQSMVHSDRSRDFQSLQNMLFIVQSLVPLDEVLGKVDGFNSLFEKNQHNFFSGAKEATDNVQKAMKSLSTEQYSFFDIVTDFTPLAQLQDPVSKSYFGTCKRALKISLENMLKNLDRQLEYLTYDCDKAQFTPISHTLDRFETVELIVPYLDRSTIDLINKTIGKTDKKSSDETSIELQKCSLYIKMKHWHGAIIKKVSLSLNNEDFTNANKFLEYLKWVVTKDHLLIKKIEIDINSEKKEQKENEDCKTIADIEKKLNMAIDEVTRHYKDTRKEGYSKKTQLWTNCFKRPPSDVYQNFIGENKTSSIYTPKWKEIENFLYNEFESDLDHIKNDRDLRRKLTMATDFFPEALKQKCKKALEAITSDIDESEKYLQDKLENVMKNNDILDISSFYKEVERSEGAAFYQSKISQSIARHVSESCSQLDKLIDTNQSELLAQFEKLIVYVNSVPCLEQPLNQLKEKGDFLRSRTNQVISSLKGLTHDHNISKQDTKTIEANVLLWKGLKDLGNKYPYLQTKKDDDEDIKKILKSHFNQIEVEYQASKNDTNLKKSILKIQAWSNLAKICTKCEYGKWKDLKAVQEEILKDFESKKLRLTQNFELMTEETMKSEKTREAYYKQISDDLKFMVYCQQELKEVCDNKFDTSQVVRSLKDKISTLYKNANNISSNKNLSSNMKDMEKFNQHYCHLLSCNKHLKLSLDSVPELDQMEQLDKNIRKEIDENEKYIASVSVDNHDIQKVSEEVSKRLIKMKSLSYITHLSEYISTSIDHALASLSTSLTDLQRPMFLQTLVTQLEKDCTVGRSIVAEHSCFKGNMIAKRNTKTQAYGLKYVMDYLDKVTPKGRKSTAVVRNQLEAAYQNFLQVYEKLIKDHLTLPPDIQPIISNVINTSQNFTNRKWDDNTKQIIPNITAHVFALWTLIRSARYYHEAKGLNSQKSFLVTPHATQVIAVFRMLAVDKKSHSPGLHNHMIELGTGEGKSVVLAVCSAVLALLGKEVSCACYSEYLSERDYNDFKDIFVHLQVNEYIHYGTFNTICERVLNSKGDIRSLVRSVIQNEPVKNSDVKGKKHEQILLIDEVDVFFHKDFYGNLYTPLACLSSPGICNLIEEVWKHRNNISFATIQKTQPYKAVETAFSNWKALIKEAVLDMIQDVQSFNSPEYIVSPLDGKIAYKEQDSISTSIRYGYKTAFAYLYETEKNTISSSTCKENLNIYINCGSFSYAELPKNFTNILGVTGTLETLSNTERKVLEDQFKIKMETYIPSMYGENKLDWAADRDSIIANEQDYFSKIRKEIDSRLTGKNPGTKRAILVVFESTKELEEFYSSPINEDIKEDIKRITEELNSKEKEERVKQATLSGQITLLTKAFGRGTDFICRDLVVEANGGVHVIQTFLSEQVSEETQIKGRTARQGDKGSYGMVLKESSLEKYLGTSYLKDILEMRRTGKYYTELNVKRNEYFETQYKNNLSCIIEAEAAHKLSIYFQNSLVYIWANKEKKDKNYQAQEKIVKDFLMSHNRGSKGMSQSRTIVLMDATGSMSLLLHAAKNTVNVMFERALAVLAEKRNSSAFELQFAVYRNYSSYDNILYHSNWESKPDALRTFMDSVGPSGGMGNEAIEAGFWHVNKEINNGGKVTQVILIGDMPPNTEEEVIYRRARFSEQFWLKKFGPAKDAFEELENIANHKIPVHAFYVDFDAKEQFSEIARISKGKVAYLDVNSPKGAEDLTDAVTESILLDLGGNDYVEAYRTKFKKGHI